MPTKRRWLVASWLLVSVGTMVLLAGTLVGFKALTQPQLDIQLHNTYFVISRSFFIGWLLVPVLLMVDVIMTLLRRCSILLHLLLTPLNAFTISILFPLFTH